MTDPQVTLFSGPREKTAAPALTVAPGSVVMARKVIGGSLCDDAGASRCAFCGDSAFAVGRPLADVCGPGFTDYDLIADADADDVCAGCAAFLGGKPSKENPPVRMGHFAVIDGKPERPDAARMLELLRNPPSGLSVLCWTSMRKRHASLRAALCGAPEVLYIGTEDGVIEWTPREVDLLDAVEDLRAKATRDQIASGEYPPHIIIALGDTWEPAEQVVAMYRPSPALDMALNLVRKPEQPKEAGDMPVAVEQRLAAEMLLMLSTGSADRHEDPIGYWSTLLPRRLAAAVGRGRTLMEAVALLMDSTRVNPLGEDTRNALSMVEGLGEDESAAVLGLWRSQPRAIIAFTRLIKEEQS